MLKRGFEQSLRLRVVPKAGVSAGGSSGKSPEDDEYSEKAKVLLPLESAELWGPNRPVGMLGSSGCKANTSTTASQAQARQGRVLLLNKSIQTVFCRIPQDISASVTSLTGNGRGIGRIMHFHL